MFGSTTLDVAIGLIFVYLLLSLIVTAGTELLASCFRWRAKNLQKGIQRLLSPALAERLYAHPLIKVLSQHGHWPSYIPSQTFALALLDTLATPTSGAPPVPEDIGSLVKGVPEPEVQKVLSLFAQQAGQDPEKLRKSIESWFDDSMDRVSGWYKRKTQVVNLILAGALTVAVNADTILVLRSLSNDAALRSALIAQAQELVKQPRSQEKPGEGGGEGTSALKAIETRMNRLTTLGLPFGWTTEADSTFRQWLGWFPSDRDRREWVDLWLITLRYHMSGWLITALAVSLGAPFWFDMLSKIVTIRSAGSIPEQKAELAEEASASGRVLVPLTLGGIPEQETKPVRSAEEAPPAGGRAHTPLTRTISMQSIAFDPRITTIAVGDTVTFVNIELIPSGIAHSIVWDTPGSPPNSPPSIPPGGSYGPVTMSAAGTFTYHCGIHGVRMSGIIIVS